MSYTFSKAMGGHIGVSLCEDDYLQYALDMMKKAEEKGVKLLLPVDNRIGDSFSNDCNIQVVKRGEIPDVYKRQAKCGDIMRIFLDIDDETHIIRDCKFKTFGCGAAVATSSMATEMVKGKTIEEAMKLTNKAVMEALDGLPPVKVHCSLLAEEAVHAALWDYAQKHHIEIEGLKKPKSDIHEGEEAEEEEY